MLYWENSFLVGLIVICSEFSARPLREMLAWVSRKTERITCKHTTIATSKVLYKMKGEKQRRFKI